MFRNPPRRNNKQTTQIRQIKLIWCIYSLYIVYIYTYILLGQGNMQGTCVNKSNAKYFGNGSQSLRSEVKPNYRGYKSNAD